jgi:glycosyltransferase involved in cell wall biosynthesis
MRSAVCCFYQAFPPVSGAASVSYNLAKFASRARVLIQLGTRDQRFVTADNVEVVTIAGASESRREKLARLPAFVNQMVAEICSMEAEVVVLEGASWAVYHWMLLRAIRRAAPQAKLVYHSHNVEYVIRSLRHSRAVAALTRWAEGRLVRDADLVTAVSEVDQTEFARLYGVKPMLLPNGVDIERFTHRDSAANERLGKLYDLDRYALLFAGFYAYPPNREAIDFLVSSVMPLLRERYPSATLALTGGGAPYRASWIRNVGAIPYEDFPSFVASCGIAVAPMFSGSGTRLKILEAMAAGTVVVATEKAAEGLGLRHREHLLLAGNPHEFVNAIAALFDRPSVAARLRKSARQRINAEYSWQAIAHRFEQAIGHMAGQDSRAQIPLTLRAGRAD